MDIEIDISQLTSDNKASLNKVATHYGLAFGDFARMLILDREEMQAIRENKLEREQDIPVKVRSMEMSLLFSIGDHCFHRDVGLDVNGGWRRRDELKNEIIVHRSMNFNSLF